MAQNMSNFDNVLQDLFDPGIRNTLNSEVVMFKHLEETDKEWSGRRIVFPVHVNRSGAVGARGDGGTLPTARNQGYRQAVVSATYNYGRITLTGPVIRSSQHAWATALSEEVERMTDDFVNDLGRQAWGTGDGRLAQIATSSTAATGSVVVPVFNRFAEPGQPGARYLYINQVIDGGTVAAPTAGFSSQTISAVSISQNPATTTDSVTLGVSACTFSSSEHFLFNRGAGGTGIEMNGALLLVDDVTAANWWGTTGFASSVMGIDRSLVSGWNATVMGNSGVARIIDGNLMQQTFDRIHIDSGKKADFIMGQHDVIRAFLDHVSADRRYVATGAPAYDAGYSNLSYNGVKLVADRQAPYNCLLVMSKTALKLMTLLDGEWADDDGSILSRVADQDAYEAYYRRYGNIMIDGNPKAAAFIRDIKVDL